MPPNSQLRLGLSRVATLQTFAQDAADFRYIDQMTSRAKYQVCREQVFEGAGMPCADSTIRTRKRWHVETEAAASVKREHPNTVQIWMTVELERPRHYLDGRE